mmetsp:Transcript_36477/g.77585  ORF Transcript_36477/g.77585 Transcript_36477/m.77585 type:complete len:492 (-) Transcript_36477:417-1892(-)
MLTPVHGMIPENGRNSRVSQDVGVANHDLVVREWPVALRGASVVVVNEGDCVLGQPADEPRGLAVAVPKTPILAIANSLLKNTFGGEVECGALLLGSIDPVHQVLSVPVLVVAQAIVVVSHVTPQLPDGPGRPALLAVKPHELSRVTLHEVEAPAVEADLKLEPSQPDADGLLNLLVLVVNVRCSIELAVKVARSILTRAVRELVSQGDGPSTPIHDAREAGSVGDACGELVPSSLMILLVSATMVHDDVRDSPNAVFVERLDEGLQGRLVAILRAVQVEELRGQVALRGDRLGRRREPDVGDAQVLETVHLTSDDAVPVAATSPPAFPIEALHQHDGVLVGFLDNLGHLLQQAAAGHSPLQDVELLAFQFLDLLLVLLAILFQLFLVDHHQTGHSAHVLVNHTVRREAEMAAGASIHSQEVGAVVGRGSGSPEEVRLRGILKGANAVTILVQGEEHACVQAGHGRCVFGLLLLLRGHLGFLRRRWTRSSP